MGGGSSEEQLYCSGARYYFLDNARDSAAANKTTLRHAATSSQQPPILAIADPISGGELPSALATWALNEFSRFLYNYSKKALLSSNTLTQKDRMLNKHLNMVSPPEIGTMVCIGLVCNRRCLKCEGTSKHFQGGEGRGRDLFWILWKLLQNFVESSTRHPTPSPSPYLISG